MTTDLNWWWRTATFLTAQTALVASVAALIHYRFRAPRARRAVWQTALIAIACIWLVETAGAGQKVRSLWPGEFVSMVQRDDPFTAANKSSAAAAPVDTPAPPHRGAPAPPVTWPATVWSVGSLILLLRAAANRAWLAWQRTRMDLGEVGTRETVARLGAALRLGPIETRICAWSRGPVAFGWWSPTVAVPADFSLRFTADQQVAMLAHELGHLAGRDPLWLALSDIVCALAWWNPLSWWAASQLRDASEAVADQASGLVPCGPSALAESLLHMGRESAESGLAWGLRVTGNRFRSRLGRRVDALLSCPVAWRELPARWRWSSRILALAVVLTLTRMPVFSVPSGSVLGLLVQSGHTLTARPPTQALIPSSAEATVVVLEDSNSPPGRSLGRAIDSSPPAKRIRLDLKLAGIREGSAAQAAIERLFNHLSPDKPAGPDAVAEFLRDRQISHTKSCRVDYLVAENAAVCLSSEQFRAALDSFERETGSETWSPGEVTAVSGGRAYVAAEDVLTLVTDVKHTPDLAGGGATTEYLTDVVKMGVTAQVSATLSSEGCDLSVMSRAADLLGYDKPDHPNKSYTLPLPHLRVAEIRGGATVPMGATLALRGPAHTVTVKLTDTVLGLFRRTHTSTYAKRSYLFVTPLPEAK